MKNEKIIFNKNLITNSAQVAQAWNQLKASRQIFNNAQNQMSATHGNAIEVNQAAILTQDYWREVDNVTTRVIRDDEGAPLLDDLLSLGTPISIGKTAALYRVSSDAGYVNRSMSGQEPETLDKVVYDHYGDPVPIFKTGYAREWREWLGLQTENIDAMSDDQEAAVAALRQDMAQYILTGDEKIKVQNFESKGITNHPHTNQVDLSASGLNIDLTSTATSNDDIINFFTKDFVVILDANLVSEQLKIFISPEIERRLNLPYSNSNGFKEGTVKDYILRYSAHIGSFTKTFELKGNHFIGYVRNAQYIKTRIAAPIGSFMKQRINPHDNYQTLVWSAFGLQIKRDFNGKSKVFNARG
ncbi:MULTISPECIES: major capsid protein [unclassified Gilliamella]|uniref:major capsid protein n=1 Tax=unclassified Gilliamella TaxID=2685620 RepID=UPI00080DC5BA|nr:major capsid protein [Gilliamella apicola]OCG35590.1 phage coat protein [Gilliamella apicola]OCG58716.1 phage coat protein [Gilliamella apicola]